MIIVDPDLMAMSALPLQVQTFDGPLGRRIIDTHIWAVREGLRGATCQSALDRGSDAISMILAASQVAPISLA